MPRVSIGHMPNEIAQWWKERPRPSQFVLFALLVILVSQFFTCYKSHNWGTLSIGSNFSTVGHYYFDPVKGGTGWEIHPWAWQVLTALALFHGTSITESRHFQRWGYWLSLPLVFPAISPGSITTTGGKIAIPALGLMLAVAIWNSFRKKPAASVPLPPPPPAAKKKPGHRWPGFEREALVAELT